MTHAQLVANLDRLNSATKYPSIPTYHTLDDSGRFLTEGTNAPSEGPWVLTEKVDGTNARLICLPFPLKGHGAYLIGSRNDLLYASGDIVHNPALGIVDALRGFLPSGPLGLPLVKAEYLDSIVVFYFEVYGGKVTAASKNYTGTKKVGARLFDIASIPLDVLSMEPEEIARWRESGGQTFLSDSDALVPENLRVPVLGTADALPTTLEGAAALVVAHSKTRAALDSGGLQGAEDIVARTADRRHIVKLRDEDYYKTLQQARRAAR